MCWRQRRPTRRRRRLEKYAMWYTSVLLLTCCIAIVLALRHRGEVVAGRFAALKRRILFEKNIFFVPEMKTSRSFASLCCNSNDYAASDRIDCRCSEAIRKCSLEVTRKLHLYTISLLPLVGQHRAMLEPNSLIVSHS